jgi:hypothetical protein
VDLLQADGHGFYRHPNLSLSGEPQFPDFVILSHTHHPIVVLCVGLAINELATVGPEDWKTVTGQILNPQVKLDDMLEGLKQRLNRDRRLRGKLEPKGILSLPLINEHDFRSRFGDFAQGGLAVLWQDSFSGETNLNLPTAISDEQFKLALSILQTAHAIGAPAASAVRSQALKMGDAIRQLDNTILLLDTEQQKAALNIPPGPQCIRGLAGTGKTVLLAMKAASIHSHFRDKRILFTFNKKIL